MGIDNKSGARSTTEQALEGLIVKTALDELERTLQLYERAHDTLIETLWDDEHERELVSEREPRLMLELIVARVKKLRMEARTLRHEVHELEDAAARRARGEAAT